MNTSYIHQYTIVADDYEGGISTDHSVGGSYISYDRAVEGMTDMIMSRTVNHSLARAITNDEEHGGLYGKKLDDSTNDDVRKYIRGYLCEKGEITFYDRDNDNLYSFSIDENDLELNWDADFVNVIKQIVNNTTKED